MEEENGYATAENARAKIAVWWDMYDCPIPEGYDARRFRPSLETAFKSLGYSGPVSVTAYGDLKHTSDHLLRGLSSTGVSVAHTVEACRSARIYSDILEWRARNRPPATMMLISDQVQEVLSWDLARLQQQTLYNLFLASSVASCGGFLLASAEWVWDGLLGSEHDVHEHETTFESSAMFYCCKSCSSLVFQSLENFRNHLSSGDHALEEIANPGHEVLDPFTRKWGRNYPAQPEYAAAPVTVWWDMNHCPIPEGYDVAQVRPSIEEEFKRLGYSGSVTINAYGDLNNTSDHLLQGLSSAGVAVAHSIPQVAGSRMFADMMKWQRLNPPPATMMLISDNVEEVFSDCLAQLQQMTKYNLFLAYSFMPRTMSVLVTSAEWLWDSLLAETKRLPFLKKCSSSLQHEDECTLLCNSCFADCKGLLQLRIHLSSDEHLLKEGRILSSQFRKAGQTGECSYGSGGSKYGSGRGNKAQGGDKKDDHPEKNRHPEKNHRDRGKGKVDDTDDDDHHSDGDGDNEVVNDHPTKGWWNLENVDTPNNLDDGGEMYGRIQRQLARRGFPGPLTITVVVAYLDTHCPRNLIQPGMNIQYARMTRRPANDQTSSQLVINKIRVLVEHWLRKKRNPQNTLLLSGDEGFVDVLESLAEEHHTTMVIYDERKGPALELKDAARIWWEWMDFLDVEDRPSKKKKNQRKKRLQRQKQAVVVDESAKAERKKEKKARKLLHREERKKLERAKEEKARKTLQREERKKLERAKEEKARKTLRSKERKKKKKQEAESAEDGKGGDESAVHPKKKSKKV